MKAPELLVSALTRPESVAALLPSQWDLLIRQARRANVLSTLANVIESQALTDGVPTAPRHHLVAATAVARQQRQAVRWEVRCIQEALAATGVPVVLLKGAAYVMADLPTARGRMFSDVDIMVPRESISRIESALAMHGWTGGHHSNYDQRYYRRWMHEIPPMQHIRRGTVIDVHHAILPETARIKVNTKALWQAPDAVPGYDNLYVLQPTDMVLHSAAHLFHEGELHNGFRDLVDLDSLLRQFGSDDAFLGRLGPRAQELGLERPLYYALRYVQRILGTPVPHRILESIPAPGRPSLRAMDFCYLRALLPEHSSCTDRWSGLARSALYVRSHWIRMPFFLLLYHLTRKAVTPDQADRKEQ